MGAILPVKQHSERLLSGMAQQPLDDRLKSIPAVRRAIRRSGKWQILTTRPAAPRRATGGASERNPPLPWRPRASIRTQGSSSTGRAALDDREPKVDEALAIAHGLKTEEYARFVALIGRTPTFTELGIVSAMWNEHCSYKSSRLHLRKLPTKAPWVIQGPGENAGVIDIGDGDACVFKMESHNHPSFIEPYQGAATGVGGILRDVFTMGARPGRLPRLPALRLARSPQDPPSRGGRRGGHRRLRQFLRRADGRRLGRLPQALRRQHPRQRDGGRRRARRRDFLRQGDRRRQSDRLSRLQDRARRHPRRDHGLGRLRGRRRGEAPDRAGRRSLRREAAARGVPRTDGLGRGRRHSGHGRGGPDLLGGRDGRQGRSRRRTRSRPRALPRRRA